MISLAFILNSLVKLALAIDLKYCSYPFERLNGTKVSIELTFQYSALVEYQDVAGKLYCTAILAAKWHDPCGWLLAKAQLPYTTAISDRTTVDPKYFWSPAIHHKQVDSFGQVFGDSHSLPVHVDKLENVEFLIEKSWQGSCQTDFTKFPFDRHKCEFKFCSLHDNRFVHFQQVTTDFSNVDFDPDSLSLFSATFLQGSLYTRSWKCGNQTCMEDCAKFEVILKRKWFPYYFNGIFVPLFLLSTLQLSGFLLPYNEPERITFSATVFLSHSMIVAQVLNYIPKTVENIILVTSINLSVLFGMLATVYFVTIYSLRKRFKFQILLIQQISTILFVIAYILLYFGTALAIST